MSNTPSQLQAILEQLATDGNSDTMWRSSDDAIRILSQAEQAIKAAVLEVIGVDEKYPEMPANSGMYNPEMVTRNQLRAEQRKAFNILMGEQL